MSRSNELFELISAHVEDARTSMPYWINTPDGIHHFESNGTLCCADCVEKEIASLKSKDPERSDDYETDGGWEIDEDGSRICSCGMRLRCTMTSYGIAEEIDHFEQTTMDVDDAYDIAEILNNVEGYQMGGDKQKLLHSRAVAIGEAFVPLLPQTNASPG